MLTDQMFLNLYPVSTGYCLCLVLVQSLHCVSATLQNYKNVKKLITVVMLSNFKAHSPRESLLSPPDLGSSPMASPSSLTPAAASGIGELVGLGCVSQGQILMQHYQGSCKMMSTSILCIFLPVDFFLWVVEDTYPAFPKSLSGRNQPLFGETKDWLMQVILFHIKL